MSSESCSTSSLSSGDDFVPIFLLRKVMNFESLRRHSYDKKRSTIRWMKQTQLQLKLSPVKTKAIQTWTCIRLLLQWGTHSGVSAESASRGSKTGLRLLFWLCRARGESSLSVERLHVDLQLSRSTCHCLHAFSFSYLFSMALRDFLNMTKRPPSVSPSNKWVETSCFSPLALLCPVDGSFIHHCLYIFYKFSQFRAAIEVAEQPPNKRRRNSSFLVNWWKLTPSFWCLSACCSRNATEDRFQRRRPTRLTVSRTQSARSSRRSKAMELSTRGKADTESGRVLPKSPARKKFRESLHLHMSSSVEIFVRPATDQCKS